MKHIKLYEHEYDQFSYIIGLYIAISPRSNELKKIEHFFNNNIGIITKSNYSEIEIKYDKKIPEYGYTIWVDRRSILHISKSKEECEIYLQANKYNI